MSKDEITVKFNITSGSESGKLLELQFPKTTKINDFVGNQQIRDYIPVNTTPKFVYKKQILKADDTLESIGYDPQSQVAITVVYVSNPNNMTNYIFICFKPDGSEIIKSIMIKNDIKFLELKEYIKNKFMLSSDFTLKADNKDITSIEDLFDIIPTTLITVDDSIENPVVGGRRRRSSTSRKSSSSCRRRSTKRRATSRKQQKRRRGSRRAH